MMRGLPAKQANSGKRRNDSRAESFRFESAEKRLALPATLPG